MGSNPTDSLGRWNLRVSKHHVSTSDSSESNYNVHILEDIVSRQKLKGKIPDMVDHYVKNLGDRKFRKRKRYEEDASSPSFTRERKIKDLFGFVNLVL